MPRWTLIVVIKHSKRVEYLVHMQYGEVRWRKTNKGRGDVETLESGRRSHILRL